MRILALSAASAILAFLHLAAQAVDTTAPRLVLQGYDTVAYFTDAKAIKGDPRFFHDWDEGRYYFASAQHRDMFASDPARFAPQFGGYCTGSMSRKVRNEGHPEAWVIVDGKLHVFGAPDVEAARKYKQVAERDLEAFRAKAARARENWATQASWVAR